MNLNSANPLQAFERATVQLKFCPNRVWAVAGEDLPNLLPHVETDDHHIDQNKHELCTFDFCEYSRRDFTSVPQRCECGKKDCRQIGYQFPRRILDEAARSGKSTAWKLSGHVMLESPRPFMAVSHVWSDGTGAGSWREGEVNECLYRFFRGIAEEFECEGIWWDTICIPQEKAARTQAIRRMHINYRDARITLVHDLFLRNWEWDPKTACFAILMSPWFSRGWTALELAQSPKVKIIFKGPQGPVIKDLDEEILAKEESGEEIEEDEHEIRRRKASQIVRNLRRKITSVNALLTVLVSRYTSWPKDLSVISALLVGVEPHESQQHTYMRIVRKLTQVSPGHLFHNAATMSGGSSWCPTSLFSMPLDNNPPYSLKFSDTGIEGKWRIISMEKALERNFLWTGSHPLIRHRIQDTLKKYPDQCSLLAECGSGLAQRALLVRILSQAEETCKPTRCQYIGAIHLRNEMAFEKVDEIVIVHSDGFVSEQEEQKPTTFEEKTSEALRQAIWRKDYVVFIELAGQVDLNDPDELGRRPLALAAERGQDQMALFKWWSFSRTESTKWRDKNGDTALHIAARMGFFFVTKTLINDRTINAQGSNNLTPLHVASMNGDLELISLLKDANVTSKDSKFGWTPLHCAADSGNQQLVKSLIDRGAQVDVQDHYLGWTPLHFAAINGHAAVVDILLCFAANVNVEDKYGWTPQRFAEANEHAPVVKLLKRNDAHIPTRAAEALPNGDCWTFQHCMAINNERGLIKRLFISDSELSFDRSAPYAPIQLAAANGLETTMRKMLRNGTSSITALTCEGDTPLHWAARHGYETLTRMLLKIDVDIDKDAKNHATLTPLHCATEEGHAATVRLLLEAGADNDAKNRWGETPLHEAADGGYEATIRVLLEAGVNVQATNNHDQTPLHYAVEQRHGAIVSVLLNAGAENLKEAKTSNGQTPLHDAALRGYEDIVRLMLEAGVDKEAKNKFGGTPLHCAASQGHEAIVRLLLEAGSDKDAKNRFGSTPLHEAASKGYEDIVRLMLEAGVNKETKKDSGETPLHEAARYGHEAVARLLLKAGSDKDAKSEVGLTPLHEAARAGRKATVRLLLKTGADKDAKNRWGETPLHEAAGHGHEAIVRLLLKAGSDKDAKSKVGLTPLHLAARTGCQATVRLLLEAGVDKEAKKNSGKTPLHEAAGHGHEAILHLLLEAGAYKEPKDNNGRSPLHHAAGAKYMRAEVHERYLAIVRLLLEVGVNKEIESNDGQTPLQEAAAAGNETFVALLQEVVPTGRPNTPEPKASESPVQ
ncbi:ankyrin repeats (3 copies) domain-containing protein [Penicillium cataractarum]|uniref:Ankyrin repeats (3 copies) domain-containing protein n=1 Tax=Penicillium cataractarum TaxID=2100454 RepID=A0A9W9SGF0_9EURO|nr:ankyrin repeats (3 copies) domain-containing protein [Penicillium cataractarum]KAJ5378157.1 ankyrin repeats (3 copies) domain-containing protein [Penicillium cataractarum]